MTTEDKPLDGRVAIVTGGGVRVGRAIAECLAHAGASLMVHYSSSSEGAEEVAQVAQASGVAAEVFGCDLAAPEASGELVAAAVDRFGKVDVLVNNAAIFLEGRLHETSLADWDRQMAINLRAPFLLSQSFAAACAKKALTFGETSQIVNIVDARIFRPAGDHFAYRVSKVGLYEMTRMLAADLAPSVRVNAVALGAILPPPGAPEDYLEELAQSRVPLRYAGAPEQVAQNVLHFLTQPFLTGVTVRLDGGEFL